ncbi:MAG: aminoglycoside phosphotransferase family protein [Rubripirellula sp.]
MNPCPVDISVLEALGVSRVIPFAQGMSGAKVFRCEHSSGGSLVLRVWSPELTEPRLSEITRLMTVIRSELPSLVPQVFPLQPLALSSMVKPPAATELDRLGSTIGLHESLSTQTLWSHCDAGYWQLVELMPGEPLPEGAGEDCIMAGVDALCRLHAAMSWFGQKREMPLAIRSRLRRLDQVHDILGKDLAVGRSLEARELLSQAVVNAISIWNQNAVRMKRKLFSQLTSDSSQPMLTHYVLRDIHRENLLFHDGEPSGFFDFDAVRVDTPWADLARWLGSFAVTDQADDSLWSEACERFALKHSVLEPGDIEWGHGFSRRLHEATSWISLGNWLVWLCVEKRRFAVPAEVVANRVNRLAATVASIA